MLVQGFLRVKGQAKITKCFVLWVNAMNVQSLSGHYLMRQQVSMIFSLHLVYLSTAAYISEKIKLDPCWRKDFQGSKVKQTSQNVTFCDLAQ